MMRPFLRSILAALLLVSAMACDSYLEVENLNEPDSRRVFATPADVEQSIADSYNTWFVGALACCAVGIQQQAAAMEISGIACTGGMLDRSMIPRIPIDNRDVCGSGHAQDWRYMYRAINQANDGLTFLDDGRTLGSPSRDARARAWAKFVQGIAHGYLAQTFNKMIVADEAWSDPLAAEFVPAATTGTAAALGMLDEAIAIAVATPFTVPGDWANGNAMTSEDLVRLARTYKARFRANAARGPADVALIDWQAVITDLNNGITQDFTIESDYNNWYFGTQEIHSFFGPYNQLSMFYMGMADTSGAYQDWLAVIPIENRYPFVVATPDLRWPRGTTNAVQRDTATNGDRVNDGLYIRNKGTSGHVRSDRGTWRWSFYTNHRYQAFYDAGYLGHHPVILKSELDFLLAEAYIRTGQEALALPIINATRAAAGLPPATLAGVPDAPSCVPRLPNGSCGSLLEALKYEKRIETMYMNTWFFDSRRWGDLIDGTAVDYPVPGGELLVLGEEIYTTGGRGRPGGAPMGTYGF